jgi:diguanylate cyclase (GGDEF)-like protein
MSSPRESLNDFHWLIEVLQTIDVGMLVVDLNYTVMAWNGFMENHSGISPQNALGENLFSVFPDIPRHWFEHKARTVVELQNRAFTTWEQRPYVFRFKNNRPITGTSEFMYQNCTFIPVGDAQGKVHSLCIIVYDVSDVAVNKIELQKANARLKEFSRKDGLTGLFNRGYWEHQLLQEFKRQQRAQLPTSLIMMDIDHFKGVNDTHGHTIGDDVIRMVAAVIRDTLRETDVAGRYGGEEFAVILPDTSGEDAVTLAERLRVHIEEQVLTFEEVTVRVTISLGVASWNSEFDSHSEWIGLADQALYQSKDLGRNRVTLA